MKNDKRKWLINTKRGAAVFIWLLSLLAINLSGSFTVCAKDLEEDYVTSKSIITPAVIHDDDSVPDITKRGGTYAAAYDARKSGWITPVKDQGKFETCWSFACAAVMEANLIKNGYAGADIDISENAIAYFFYNRQTDRLGYSKGDHNMIARTGYDYLTASGTLPGTGIALTSGAGILTEAQSPYLTTPNPSLCYSGDYAVKAMYLYNYNTNNLTASIDKIKSAIMDHGAVATGIFYSTIYYNADKASYYSPIKSGNHAVTIVGWDDSYSQNNFAKKPGRDGAWIVKNSYGTKFGDKGYFYISYADNSLAELVSFEMCPKASSYNNIYEHDGTGNPAYAYNSASHYANVFKAKGAGSYNEELKAISLYTTSVGTNYEIQVYTGLTSASKPTGGTKAFTSSVKGSLADAGYQLIELPEPVSLTAGEYFSVVVRLTTSSGSNAYMGMDTSYFNAANDWIRFIASTAKNQSFIKVKGKWYDLGTKLKANARIRAYTDVTAVKSNFRLSTSNLGVSKGDTQTLSLLAAEHVHRKITWKSTNSNIASVSLAGKVKGKKYGTTTIKGTFVAGSGKKTLKCKVTVGPPKMKGFSVACEGPVKVSWKKNKQAAGYEVVYCDSVSGRFTKFASLNKKNKTSVSKQLPAGTYYVKMRAFMKSGKKKLYGSYTAPVEVIVP